MYYKKHGWYPQGTGNGLVFVIPTSVSRAQLDSQHLGPATFAESTYYHNNALCIPLGRDILAQGRHACDVVDFEVTI